MAGMSGPGCPDEALILAMPLRELLGVRGLAPASALAPLESLAADAWLATPSAIAADPLARAVHLGVLAVRAPGEVLLDGGGRLLHHAPVPAEGAGDPLLGALRRLAVAAGVRQAGLAEEVRVRAELAGWLHEPALPGLERAVVLVYRLAVPAGTPAPHGSAWVSRAHLAGLALEPACTLALGALG